MQAFFPDCSGNLACITLRTGGGVGVSSETAVMVQTSPRLGKVDLSDSTTSSEIDYRRSLAASCRDVVCTYLRLQFGRSLAGGQQFEYGPPHASALGVEICGPERHFATGNFPI